MLAPGTFGVRFSAVYCQYAIVGNIRHFGSPCPIFLLRRSRLQDVASTSPYKSRFISTAVAHDDERQDEDDDLIQKVAVGPRHVKDSEKRLALGRLRNKKSGKTFRAKTTPLPVQSFGKPAEVIIINRVNADRAEEEQKQIKHAVTVAPHEQDLDPVNRHYQRQTTAFEKDIAQDILQSIEDHGQNSSSNQAESSTFLAIAQLRPVIPTGESAQLDQTEFQSLRTKLVKSFTFKQLHKYRRKFDQDRSAPLADQTKRMSKRWVVSKSRGPENTRYHKGSQAISKHVLATQILTNVWNVPIPEDSAASFTIRATSKPDVIKILAAGGMYSPVHLSVATVQWPDIRLEVPYMHEIRQNYRVDVKFGLQRPKKASTSPLPAPQGSQQKPIIILSGSPLGIAEAAKRIDALETAMKKYVYEIELKKFCSTDRFHAVISDANVKAISTRSRAILSLVNQSNSNGKKNSEETTPHEPRAVAKNSPCKIRISAASAAELDQAKSLLASVTGYLDASVKKGESHEILSTSKTSTFPALVPISPPMLTPLHGRALFRKVAVSTITEAIPAPPVKLDIDLPLRDLLGKQSKPMQTVLPYGWQQGFETKISISCGLRCTTMATAPGNLLSRNLETNPTTEPAVFLPMAPNSLSVLRSLGLRSKFIVSKSMEAILVPDMLYGSVVSYLPQLRISFKVEENQIQLLNLKAITACHVHDILLPEYPIDLRLQTYSVTGIVEEHNLQAASASFQLIWRDFMGMISRRFFASENMHRIPGPHVQFDTKSLLEVFQYQGEMAAWKTSMPGNKTAKEVGIKYLIKDIATMETISFEIPARNEDESTSNHTYPASFSMTSSEHQNTPRQTLSLQFPTVHESSCMTEYVSKVEADIERDKTFINTALWLARQFGRRVCTQPSGLQKHQIDGSSVAETGQLT